MSKKLFVGGLSWGTDSDALHDAFAAHGEVTEAKVISDRETGRSRGFGFVTFADDSDADAAINAMNGTELDGRSINVNEARERRDRGPSNRSHGGGGGYNRW
ncbi:MAG: RNA-binding protein [Myxococcales bacterium]|nr:RNA-binding protein [Myxococcales bacterium]